jgi:translation initiation factor IF-2
MRVFELAKQLSVPSKDLINDLKTIGVTVSNHMAALEEDAVTQILNKFGSVKKETSKTASTLVVKKKAPTARPQPAAKVAPAPDEPPKGE